jgi:DNA polymerase elongation subunit (family B)
LSGKASTERGKETWEVRLLNGNYWMERPRDEPVVELYGRTRDGRSVVLRNHGFLPYIYFAEPSDANRARLRAELDSRSEVLGLDEKILWVGGRDRKCVKVTMRHPFKVPEYRGRYGERSDFGEGTNVLAADIPFVYRFIFDRNIAGCTRVTGREVPELKGDYTVDLVVEVESYEDCEPFHPPLTILSFDIENSILDKHIFTVCLAVRKGGGDIISRAISGSEKDIIVEFQKALAEYDPDIVTGYNIDNYDIPVMLERAIKFGIRMEWGRDFKEVQSRNERFWSANGRVIADAWWNAKKQLRPKKETLNAIAELVLGERKDDVDPRKIDQEWADDKDKVIKYCKKDADLALRILEKVAILEKSMDLATVSRLPLDDVINGRTSTLIDSILIREADRGNIGVPMTRRDSKSEKIEGGYVHTIEPGVYHWVIVLDFKSMYPSIIITNNLCFTTISKDGEIVSPYNDVRFLSKEKKEGLFPKILAKLMKERDATKKKAKEAKAAGNADMARYLNGLQDAIKILMNSFYGVLASDFYRFTDNDIGASITAFARRNVTQIIKTLSDEGVGVIYGDSVGADSEIVVREGEHVRFARIADLFRNVEKISNGKEYSFPSGVEALTIDEGGSAVFRPMKYVVRHRLGTSKRMFRVKITDEWYVDVTEDHSLIGYLNKKYLPEGEIQERLVEVRPTEIGKTVSSLVTIREIPLTSFFDKGWAPELFEFFGLFIGDGSFDRKVNVKNHYIHLACGDDLDEIVQKVITPLRELQWIKNYWPRPKGDIVINGPIVRIMNGLFRAETGEKMVPPFMECEEPGNIASFMRGLYSSDGTVLIRNDTPIVRFTNTRWDLVSDMRRLLWRIGISHSVFREGKPNFYRTKMKTYGGTTYSYHVNIKDVPRFAERVGFVLDRKNVRVEGAHYGVQKYTTMNYDFDISTVRAVEPIETPEYVYDIEVEGTHRFFANGILVHNTDSIFLKSPEPNLDGARRFGESLAARFSRESAVLEFEKVMEPFFTHGAKKRYVGRVQWPTQETLVRGYETRRTDAFDYVSESLSKIFEMVLDGDPDEAVKMARKMVGDVLEGKVPVEKLVISRTVKDVDENGAYANPDNMANVQAAKKLVQLGFNFVPGMKVSWIVTNGKRSPQEVEPFVDGRAFTGKPDWDYYARRVATSLARVTETFGWQERDLISGQRQVSLEGFGGGGGKKDDGRGPGNGGSKKKAKDEKKGPVTLTDFM